MIESESYGTFIRMSTRGERIKYVRKLCRFTQDGFAAEFTRRTGKPLTRGAVGNWERDEGVSMENMTLIAQAFPSVTVDWLANGTGPGPNLDIEDWDKGGTLMRVPAPPLERILNRSEDGFDGPPLPMPNASAPEPARYGRSRRPMYGHAFGGRDDESKIVLNGAPLAHLVAPPAVEFVPDAFAVQIGGTSMLERFRDGDVAWVDPSRSVRAGDDVLIELHDENGDGRVGYVKRFVSKSPRELVVEQLNPPEGEDRILRFAGDRVIHIRLIVDIGIGR